MSDDNPRDPNADNDADNIIDKSTLFEEKYTRNRAAPLIIGDPKAAFNYFNSFCWAYKGAAFAIIVYDEDTDKYIVTDQTNFERMFQEHRLLRTDEVTGRSKLYPITEFWLKGPHRFCTEIVFHPGLKVDDSIVNLWRGFKTKPKAGRCKRLLFHVRYVLCGGNEEHYEYLMNYLAHLIQRPGEKPGITLVLGGRKGAGKSFLFENVMASIIDGPGRAPESYFQTADSKLVFGDFNAQMEKNIMFVAEEAFWAVHNFTRMVIIGNDDWLIPATYDERRYFVLNVSEKFTGKMWYYDAMLHENSHGGLEAFMHVLSQRNISKFDIRKVPHSVALDQQKDEALDVLDKFLYGILSTSQLSRKISDDGSAKVYRTHLFDAFVRFEKSLGVTNRYTPEKFAINMLARFPSVVNGKIVKHANGRAVSIVKSDGRDTDNARLWYYLFPDIELCRAAWDFYRRQLRTWDRSEGWETTPYEPL